MGGAPLELVLEDLEGRPRSLASLSGRIVVLNFWATWCGPCRAEMPLLARLHAEFAARGVEVVGASADAAETRDRIPAVIERAGIRFPIWVGATTGDMQRFGVGTALPATAILDRDGVVVFRLMGAVEEAALRERIGWLLGTRDAPEPPVEVRAPPADATPGHDDGEATDHPGDVHAGHDHDHGDAHADADDHGHAVVALEGASLVPS